MNGGHTNGSSNQTSNGQAVARRGATDSQDGQLSEPQMR
jgi:hypothetical protein